MSKPGEPEMEKAAAATKIEAEKFLAQCRECRRWQEVSPKAQRSEGYFEVWEVDFQCCNQKQTARFTLEKDYLDFH